MREAGNLYISFSIIGEEEPPCPPEMFLQHVATTQVSQHHVPNHPFLLPSQPLVLLSSGSADVSTHLTKDPLWMGTELGS